MKRRRTILGLALIAVTILAVPSTTVRPASALAVTWSPPTRLTRSLAFDFLPQIIQTKDQKVWLFWEAVDFFTPNPDIHYKTWDWSSWSIVQGNLSLGGSPEQMVVGTSYQEASPSAVQMKNGTLFLSFSSDRSGNFDIYLKSYNPESGWSSDYQVTTNSLREESSSMVAANDGSLWIFFDRLDPSTGVQNTFYKKYVPGTGWTTETALTTSGAPVRNREPRAFQMRDGRIWLFWSQVQDVNFNKVYLYYRIFDGTTWQSQKQFTNTNSQDRHPQIIQDANSTILVVWSRELSEPGGCTQEDLFYKYSTNNGSTWSPEIAIINDDSITDCNNDIAPDDNGASIAQLTDFKIWLFWHSTRDFENWWDLYYTTTNAFPVHDVAVNSISFSPLLLRGGNPVTVFVTVSNPGGYTETLQLSVTAKNVTTITIATRTVTLQSGGTASYTFIWDTSNINPARYKIMASLQAVSGESPSNQANNSLDAGTVHLVPPADVNYDGKVDILDAGSVAYSYNAQPGSPLWNANADLDNNLRIDIIDAAVVAFWFGASG